MMTEGSQGAPPGGQGDAPGTESAGKPTEEEVRRKLEEELRNVRVQDLLLQSVVSLVNLAARRIAKEDERDLEQGRVGIEAVRSLIGLLEPGPADQIRNALSELQMLYARESGAGAAPATESGKAGAEDAGRGAAPAQGAGEGPAPGTGTQGGRRPRPGLWTPPGSV